NHLVAVTHLISPHPLLVKADLVAGYPAQREVGPVDRLAHGPDLRILRCDRGEDNLCLQHCERLPETGMGTATEPQMRIGMTGEVERVWPGEPGRVAVSGAEQYRHRIAGRYDVIPKSLLHDAGPAIALHRRGKTHYLFHRRAWIASRQLLQRGWRR